MFCLTFAGKYNYISLCFKNSGDVLRMYGDDLFILYAFMRSIIIAGVYLP